LAVAIKAAFATVPYPGDDDIVHCEYDARHGGTLPGPCRECSEAVAQFKGTGALDHSAKDVRYGSVALASFSPAAFAYWLPSFLVAALLDPTEADIAIDSIEYRLRSSGDERELALQAKRLALLSCAQLEVLVSYFEFQLENRNADLVDANSSLESIRAERQRRCT
jgi:hypothetical protein